MEIIHPASQDLQHSIRNVIDHFDPEPSREGLAETPQRYIKFLEEFLNPAPFRFTTFDAEGYDEMIVQTNIPFYSLCIPSRQEINAVKGRTRAAQLRSGDQLWTLVNGKVERTTIVDIESRDTRELVEVDTSAGRFQCTPDHPWATPDGWFEAKDLQGKSIEWTFPKSLHRNRYEPMPTYDFGYVIGAIFSDGTVGKRYLSLVVNERWFAEKFAKALEGAFGILPNIEPCERPSGYTKRMTPGWRVRVVSSYLADLFRMYAGGDAHHMRQQFPRVVLNSLEVFQGFLDGYIDGDGFRLKKSDGSTIVSGNIPFLESLSKVIGARFTPRPDAPSSKLYVADSWLRKHGFPQEDHRTSLIESSFVEVLSVKPVAADGKKPFKVYSFKCEPYPTFLVHGHLSHNCEHHIAPFFGTGYIAYIPDGKIVGLSKLARVLDKFARRFQNQERITKQVAEFLTESLQPKGVGVVLRAQHLCMAMRGVQKHDTWTTTSQLTGLFLEKQSCRAEFLSLIK